MVDFVLSQLEKIIHDSKTVSFFTIHILDKLLLLYNPKNKKNLKSKKGKDIEVHINDKNEHSVPDRVHEFLQKLCTQPGVGLCQSDKRNQTLLKLLLNLNIITNSKQRELFMEIITRNSNLIHQFWLKTTLSFEPRSTVHYLSNMALATYIINIPYEFQNIELGPPSLKQVLGNIVPTPITKSIIGKSIMNTSVDVYYSGLVLLQTIINKFLIILKNLDLIIDDIKNDPHLLEANLEEIVNNWQNWKHLLLSTVREKLPDYQIIIKHLKPIQDSELIKSQDIFVVVVEILRNYLQIVPEQFLEHTFDFSKAIPPNLLSMNDESCIGLLKLLLKVDDFKWYNKYKESDSSCFRILFQLYLQTKNQQVMQLLETNFQLYFKKLFMFQNHSKTISLLLKLCKRFQFDENIPEFLEQILLLGFFESKKLLDEMVSLVGDKDGNLTLFPPVCLVLLRKAFKTTITTIQLLTASFIIEVSQSVLNIAGLEYLKIVLFNYLKGVKAADLPIMAKLYNWINMVMGSEESLDVEGTVMKWKQGIFN